MTSPAERSPRKRAAAKRLAAKRLEERRVRGGKARQAGRASEWIAAFWLIAQGWRIIGFRLRTPQGEIDLLARRGEVLAVMEVKRRATLDAALQAVTYRQRRRLRAAAEAIAANRPEFAGLFVRLDLIALAPRRFPRHIADAWAGLD